VRRHGCQPPRTSLAKYHGLLQRLPGQDRLLIDAVRSTCSTCCRGRYPAGAVQDFARSHVNASERAEVRFRMSAAGTGRRHAQGALTPRPSCRRLGRRLRASTHWSARGPQPRRLRRPRHLAQRSVLRLRRGQAPLEGLAGPPSERHARSPSRLRTCSTSPPAARLQDLRPRPDAHVRRHRRPAAARAPGLRAPQAALSSSGVTARTC
jgi:hypothetical protein